MESINLSDLVNIKSHELPKEFDKFNVIYKITNLINGDSYIGQAKSFKERYYVVGIYEGYVPCIIKYITSSYSGSLLHKLFPAFRKYGIDNFEVSILEHDIDSIDLSNREIHWISYYNTFLGKGYNLTKGGDGGTGIISSNCRKAGRDALEYIYSETNGASPQFISAGHSQSRLNSAKRSYSALVEMCTNADLDGFLRFTKESEYLRYKVNYSPQYKKAEIKRAFRNYREFGFDITLISQFIRNDWQ